MPVPALPPAALPPRPPLWRTLLHAPVSARAWRDYAYLMVGSILAAFAFGTLATLVWLSIVLIPVLVGILLFGLTVRAARAYAAVPRHLAVALLDEPVATPPPAPPPARAPRLARRQLRRRRRVAGDRVHPRVHPR